MAKQTKLTVATPLGTFTRTTARAYSHIVVVADHTAEYSARVEGWDRDRVTGDLEELENRVAGREALYPWKTIEEVEAQLAHSREEFANLETRARERRDRAARPDVLGWCGRLDLARKLASTTAASHYQTVRIFSVASGEEVR